jgi:hypothetical protein
MPEKTKNIEESHIEEELKKDIEQYLSEKEHIRKIVGKIGGQSTRFEKLINEVFLFLVLAAFALPFVFEEISAEISIEIAILLVSLKLFYFLYQSAKVSHFQFWMLSSIEWRLNEMAKKVNAIEKKMKDD